MPYVSQDVRKQLAVNGHSPKTSGELNYVITNLLIDYVEDKGTSYETINSIVGVLECAKLEFYRRFAAPYENTKIAENGDVYF